jgi:hypothetical protein
MPSLDVRFRLLPRRFSANTQSVSIKIFRAAPNFGGLFLKAYERAQNEELRLLLSSIQRRLAPVRRAPTNDGTTRLNRKEVPLALITSLPSPASATMRGSTRAFDYPCKAG